ncbi:hypothetical protein [Thermoplasma volcanium]|nr:hypothetical protein [Thermoplasma volcanium]
MGIFWLTNIIIILIEAALLATIIAFYVKTIIAVKSKFLLPIVLFSTLFLLQSILSVYYYYNFSHFVGASVSVPLILINSIGLASFIVLFVSLRQ